MAGRISAHCPHMGSLCPISSTTGSFKHSRVQLWTTELGIARYGTPSNKRFIPPTLSDLKDNGDLVASALRTEHFHAYKYSYWAVLPQNMLPFHFHSSLFDSASAAFSTTQTFVSLAYSSLSEACEKSSRNCTTQENCSPIVQGPEEDFNGLFSLQAFFSPFLH